MELEKYNYNAQAYFYGKFANHVHPHIPVSSFTSHFAESYTKKFQLFEEDFNSQYEERPTEENLNGLLRKLVFENRVGFKDVELVKLSNYYIAHVTVVLSQRRYLSMLNW